MTLCLCVLLLQRNAVPSSLRIEGSNKSNSSFLDLSSPSWMLQVCFTHTHTTKCSIKLAVLYTHTHSTNCSIKLAVLCTHTHSTNCSIKLAVLYTHTHTHTHSTNCSIKLVVLYTHTHTLQTVPLSQLYSISCMFRLTVGA